MSRVRPLRGRPTAIGEVPSEFKEVQWKERIAGKERSDREGGRESNQSLTFKMEKKYREYLWDVLNSLMSRKTQPLTQHE